MMKHHRLIGLCILIPACGDAPGLTREDLLELSAKSRAEAEASQREVEMSCTITLEEFQEDGTSCPPRLTPADAIEPQVCRDEWNSWIRVGSAEGYDVVLYTYGAGGTSCVYEPPTGELVGILVLDDANYFCNGRSSTLRAGVYPNFVDVEAMITVDCSGQAPSELP